MRTDRVRILFVGGLLAVCGGVAGCDGATTTANATASAAAPASQAASSPFTAPPTAAPSTTSRPSGPIVEVKVANGSVGAYLTGAAGRTLYTSRWDPENGSTCNLTCAETWPPFVPGAGETVVAGDRVTGALATFARADGARQLSYRGRPLYYYSGDQKAGDTSGDGNGSIWSVARP
jgi:predicted lipoprotein with Yx(FWY)xxD motif